jgi:hypothetical protein
MTEDDIPPDSLLPYDSWMETAMRAVIVEALKYVIANGLPGEHHFYITFRTDYPGVAIPARLRTQYPQEMTIVLQHQFHDLAVDEAARHFSVRLAFGGVPATLVIPLDAITGFADPHVRYGLHLTAAAPEPGPASAEETPEPQAQAEATQEKPQVVSLDAFRRRNKD